MQGAGSFQPITDSQIDAMLTRGIEAARRLLDVLARETESLKRNDAAGIEATACDKQALLTELKHLDGHGLLSSLKQHPRTDEFRTLLQRCRQNNELNGGAILARLRHTQQVLEILRGQPAADTYGKQGEAGAAALSQRLAKA
jgi:flagellar biosynthesis/type III secretory pathway chaperone